MMKQRILTVFSLCSSNVALGPRGLLSSPLRARRWRDHSHSWPPDEGNYLNGQSSHFLSNLNINLIQKLKGIMKALMGTISDVSKNKTKQKKYCQGFANSQTNMQFLIRKMNGTAECTWSVLYPTAMEDLFVLNKHAFQNRGGFDPRQ